MIRLFNRASGLLSLSSPQELAHCILKHRDIRDLSLFDNPSLRDLDSPFSLLNINKVTERLISAIENKEIIGIISDHDCDGQTACAVLTWNLLKIFQHPPELLLTYIGHRTEEGYGVSTKLCDRILNASILPAVIITADCGSSDHTTIQLLADKGIEVIVTDHHTVPDKGVPDAAYAVINPNQPGCTFPDKHVAGCFVAWFVMAAVRNRWQIKHSVTLRSMSESLDFVAIGTMSDCVSLKTSINNRIVLRFGLNAIRQQRRPCWRVLRQTFREFVNSDFLVFKLIPLINADGRLFDALNGIKFLLSTDTVTAQEVMAELIQTNQQRRYLQKKQLTLTYALMSEACDHEAPGLIINLGPEGHHGIHGVTASRLLSTYKKVSIIFSQHHEAHLLTGSARSPDFISLRELLDTLATNHPNLLKRYGGHHQAAGLAIAKEDFAFFKQEINALIDRKLSSRHTALELEFDGILPSDHHYNVNFFIGLEHYLEPFGKDFNRPIFGLYATLEHAKVMGEDQNHLQLFIKTSSQTIKCLFFFTEEPYEVLAKCEQQECLYIGEFMVEEFQKKQQLSFFLKGIYHPATKKWITPQEVLPAHLEHAQKLMISEPEIA